MKYSAEIDEDMKFQKREWKMQRIAWLVFGLFLLAAFLGVFGSGPINHSTQVDPQGLLSVEYEPLVRRQSPTRLKLQLKAPAQKTDRAQFWIASDCLDALEISQVTPAPERMEAMGKRVVYSYPPSREKRELIVGFHFQPLRIGRLPCRIGYPDGTEVEFIQFIYP
jgi:hypothetical protein